MSYQCPLAFLPTPLRLNYRTPWSGTLGLHLDEAPAQYDPNEVNVREPNGTSLSHPPPQAEEPIRGSATASALFEGAMARLLPVYLQRKKQPRLRARNLRGSAVN